MEEVGELARLVNHRFGTKPKKPEEDDQDLAGELADVLFVGRPAFGQEDGTIGLFRLSVSGGTAERIQVQLGRSSVTTVEIVGGLQENDQVILSDMSAWDAFDRVRLN